jgi:hypothetical protein
VRGTLREGGEVAVVSFAGERLHLDCARAFAPGSPIVVDLVIPTRESSLLTLEGRTLASKRRADGRFEVRLRLINLRREAREALAAAVDPPASKVPAASRTARPGSPGPTDPGA